MTAQHDQAVPPAPNDINQLKREVHTFIGLSNLSKHEKERVVAKLIDAGNDSYINLYNARRDCGQARFNGILRGYLGKQKNMQFVIFFSSIR
jgi:hypothetical protein